MAKKGWYYEFSWLVRIIISIIPIVSTVVHLLARLSGQSSLLTKVLLIVVHVIFGWNLFWLVDIITTIVIRRLLFT